MRRMTWAMCWLILETGLVPSFAHPAEEAQKQLQGTWTATKAVRDGIAAEDIVGHQLSFTGRRFQIQSTEGKVLYAGTLRVDPSAKPESIDFEHTEGALKRKAWKGSIPWTATRWRCATTHRTRAGPQRSRRRRAPGMSSSRSSVRSPEREEWGTATIRNNLSHSCSRP